MKTRVYLAGAIDLISPDQAKAWRKKASEALARLGAKAIDPLSETVETVDPMEIYERNRKLLMGCEAVLAEHAYPVPHYGTTVEIEEAVRAKIPVVVWTGELRVPIYLARLGIPLERDLDRAVFRAFAAARARSWHALLSGGMKVRSGLLAEFGAVRVPSD